MTRTWWENEEILRRFRDWLTGATDEALSLEAAREEALAEAAQSALPEAAQIAVLREAALSAAIQAGTQLAAAEARALTGAGEEDVAGEPCENGRAPGEHGDVTIERRAAPVFAVVPGFAGEPRFGVAPAAASDPEEPLPDVGLRQLVEAFTALRQENKLQTKSARGLEQALQTAVGSLDGAVRQLLTIQAREQEAADRASLPLAQACVALHESLLRARDSFQRTGDDTAAETGEALRSVVDERMGRLSPWRRRLAGFLAPGLVEELVEAAIDQTGEALDRETAALEQGLEMILSRATRQLAALGIERIATEGRSVDPARMSVVELASDQEAPPETVVDEIRPGYQWRGRVLQYAEVRATPAAAKDAEDAPGG